MMAPDERGTARVELEKAQKRKAKSEKRTTVGIDLIDLDQCGKRESINVRQAHGSGDGSSFLPCRTHWSHVACRMSRRIDARSLDVQASTREWLVDEPIIFGSRERCSQERRREGEKERRREERREKKRRE